MDYNHGDNLFKYQWDLVDDPSAAITWFFGEEEMAQVEDLFVSSLDWYEPTEQIFLEGGLFLSPSGKPFYLENFLALKVAKETKDGAGGFQTNTFLYNAVYGFILDNGDEYFFDMKGGRGFYPVNEEFGDYLTFPETKKVTEGEYKLKLWSRGYEIFYEKNFVCNSWFEHPLEWKRYKASGNIVSRVGFSDYVGRYNNYIKLRGNRNKYTQLSQLHMLMILIFFRLNY